MTEDLPNVTTDMMIKSLRESAKASTELAEVMEIYKNSIEEVPQFKGILDAVFSAFRIQYMQGRNQISLLKQVKLDVIKAIAQFEALKAVIN